MKVLHITNRENWSLNPIQVANSEGDHKPNGVLWTSPVKCFPSWIDFNRENEYEIGPYQIELDIEADGGLVIYDPVEVMDKLPWIEYKYSTGWVVWGIDWEKVASDGVRWVHVTARALDYKFEFFSKYKKALICWDCETVVILTEEAIIGWRELDKLEL